MRKILFLLSFLMLTSPINADSWKEYNKKIVDDYMTVGWLLLYGTYSDKKDYDDAFKYISKGLKIMKDYNLKMNTYQASDVYNGLGHYYSSHAMGFDTKKENLEKAIHFQKKAIYYLQLAYDIRKKLTPISKYKTSLNDVESTLILSKLKLKSLIKATKTIDITPKVTKLITQMKEEKEFVAINTDKCTGCHGTDFTTAALGKSKIIQNMSKEDIIKALIGYKYGSYGGSMKSLMKGQISNFSDNEIKAFAQKIGK